MDLALNYFNYGFTYKDILLLQVRMLIFSIYTQS